MIIDNQLAGKEKKPGYYQRKTTNKLSEREFKDFINGTNENNIFSYNWSFFNFEDELTIDETKYFERLLKDIKEEKDWENDCSKEKAAGGHYVARPTGIPNRFMALFFKDKREKNEKHKYSIYGFCILKLDRINNSIKKKIMNTNFLKIDAKQKEDKADKSKIFS